MNFYDEYLKQNDTTRYKVSKLASISASTLQRAANTDEIENISLRIVLATAKALNKTPGQVTDELLDIYNQHK